MPFTASSSWTWVGHPVSGLPELTLCPLKTRFPFGSVPSVLNLASPGNSPDRSTKSTRLHFDVLPQLVNTGFQVLFHSPPGVLFTFPSQYYALSVTKSHKVPRVSWYSGSRLVSSLFMYGAFTLSGRLSQNLSIKLAESIPRSEPRHARTPVWPLPISLAATLGITCCFLFLALLRCFSSGGSPPYVMDWRMDD